MVVLLRVLQWIINIVSYIVQKREKKVTIPKPNDGILYISATKLAQKIRKKEISCEQVILAYIRRIEEVNPIINAVIDSRFTDALLEAKKVDEYLSNLNTFGVDILPYIKPLLGVPITIKESLAVKDLSYTGCSLIRQGIKATHDAEVVKLLKDAGAIVLLVSNTSEYCSSIETSNKIIGRTKNPYDTRRSSGGSSGGEAALLGSGASLIGIGTDIDGSLRLPCSFNGIYGHKPTSGIISPEGHFPWSDDSRWFEYLSVGPMTRYVGDLKLVLKALTKNNTQLNLDKKVNFKSLNVFYMEDFSSKCGYLKVDKIIKTAIREAVGYLCNSHDCQVNDTKFPEMNSSYEMSKIIFQLENQQNAFTDSEIKYSPRKEFWKYLIGKSIFSFQYLLFHYLRNSKKISKEKFESYLKIISEFKESLSNVLGNNGIFLSPNYPTEAFKHNGSANSLTGTRFTTIANILGYPATCIPIGKNKNGLPLSIQIMAAPYQDILCLEVAEKLEEYFGGWQPPY